MRSGQLMPRWVDCNKNTLSEWDLIFWEKLLKYIFSLNGTLPLQGFFMKRLFILLLHLLTMSMAVYQRPNTKVLWQILYWCLSNILICFVSPTSYTHCSDQNVILFSTYILRNFYMIHTEHLIIQQHSLLRGIKSESGEITTEDISRYCFEVYIRFLVHSSYIAKVVVFATRTTSIFFLDCYTLGLRWFHHLPAGRGDKECWIWLFSKVLYRPYHLLPYLWCH